MAVEASLFGDEGAVATRRTQFQVANCANLSYGPKLNLRLTGGVRRHGHPAIHAVFKATPGEANSQRVSVTLPRDEFLDNAHIGTVCTRVAFASGSCPPGSRIGKAEAITPLLDLPLTGNVYLRSSSHKLPDMVLDLKGQIDIELVGKVDSVKGRLRTIFESVPDAPLSKFVLNLEGGKKGLVINSESLCTEKKEATVKTVGQNGMRSKTGAPLNPSCGSSGKKRTRRTLEGEK